MHRGSNLALFTLLTIIILSSSFAFASEVAMEGFGSIFTLGLLSLVGVGHYGMRPRGDVPRSLSLRDHFDHAVLDFRSYVARSAPGRYWQKIHEAPVDSERMLGVFFFWKTAILTAIAFYSEEPMTLAALLVFCSSFDALTGVYQHTIMNFCHRSFFRGHVLQTVENLARRFIIDIFRAEIITLIVLGGGFVSLDNQSHIFINRLVSGSYYFNAVFLDKLVASGTLCRNFRSRFIIFASTLGSLLCTLDLARTKAPEWLPSGVGNALSWMPKPLDFLMGFNILVLIVMASAYFFCVVRKKPLQ